MNGSKSTLVNTVLMALVGLLVGFIGGYWIGQHNQPATAALTAAAQPGQVFCPHDLEPKDTWIEAGFRCPGTDTVQAVLANCHCPTAHGIKDKIKAELAAGKKGDEIRRDLIAEYGDRLKFRGQ